MKEVLYQLNSGTTATPGATHAGRVRTPTSSQSLRTHATDRRGRIHEAVGRTRTEGPILDLKWHTKWHTKWHLKWHTKWHTKWPHTYRRMLRNFCMLLGSAFAVQSS